MIHWLAVLVSLLLPAELRKAIDDYEFGEVEAACPVLERLRYNETFDAEARLVTMKYLGACRHVAGDKTAAQEAFGELLDLDPNAQLDPVQFPPDMVAFFDALKQQRRARVAPPPPPPPAKTEPPGLRVEEPMEPAPSGGYAWAPFGVGQFANGQDGKGTALAVLQGLSLATGVVGLGMFEAEKETGSFLQGGEFRDTARAGTLHTTYLVGFGTFAALWVYGIIDASVNAP